MMYSGTCRAESGDVQVLSPGTTTASSRNTPAQASQALGECMPRSRTRNCFTKELSISELGGGAAFGGEHALRAPLDEQDEDHEQHDLSEHGARQRLQELVGDAQADG